MTSYKDLLDQTPEYMLKVKQYAKLLIDEKIWDSISHNDLDGWLHNFKTPEEKLLSALLLDSLIYRSAQQTTALLRSALECALPLAIYDCPNSVINGDDFLKIFTSKSTIEKIRIVPVIRNADPPTKSGPSIARMYRRNLSVNDNYMIWPWLIEENYNNGIMDFVFIDDVLATGQQASEFLQKLELHKFSNARFSYIPLLAHQDGIDKLNEDHELVRVSPVETLDKNSCFFTAEKMSQIHDLESLYLEVSKKFLNRRLFSKMAKGYNDMSLTFSYYHATPNASLPLYWYESDTFAPLVRR